MVIILPYGWKLLDIGSKKLSEKEDQIFYCWLEKYKRGEIVIPEERNKSLTAIKVKLKDLLVRINAKTRLHKILLRCNRNISMEKSDLIIEAIMEVVDIEKYLKEHQLMPACEFYEEGSVDILRLSKFYYQTKESLHFITPL